ncbi:MAG: hypothetical protein M1817_002913 [Caeruleum heppii]|nr:MAG: hypothetical protein M1817_002913 [Caeruleum heppii]
MASSSTDSMTEADIIQNKVNVLLAKQQRLLASWLPPPTPTEQAHTKSQDQIDRDEEAMFTPIPSTVGVGAPIPEDLKGGPSKRSLTANDLLRKRMLGRDAKTHSASTSRPGVKPSPTSTARHSRARSVDESDEEGGRSQLGKTKRQKLESSTPASDDIRPSTSHDHKPVQDEKSRGQQTWTFLDQALWDKSQRQRKKKKKKKGNTALTGAEG